MAWGAQTWTRLTPEATYATFDGAGTPTWTRLHSDDAFTMRATPLRQVIRSADAGNRRRQVVAGRTEVAGKLKTILYPGQAATLLGAALNLTANDLQSFTIDFFDSVRVHRFLGCKVKALNLTSSADQDYLTLDLDWIAQRLDPTFTTLAQPLDSVFPDERPFEHYEAAGNVTVGGSALTLFKSINLAVTNVLVPTWDELPHISRLYYCGRDVDFTTDCQYVAATFRAALEAQSPLAGKLKWARTGPAKSVEIDLKSRTYVGSVQDKLPLSGVGYQTVKIETFYDPSSGVGTDAALTVV